MNVNHVYEDSFFTLILENSSRLNDAIFEQLNILLLNVKPHHRKTVTWMVNRELKKELLKNDGSQFSGGILANINNLDKITEIIYCIIANPAPLKFFQQNVVFYHCPNNNENKFKSLSIKKVESSIVVCYCNKTQENNTLVICVSCGVSQHAQCVRFDPNNFDKIPYLCPFCWTINEKYIQCKATLIIVPQLILNQWIDEIEQVKKFGLKVFVYNGVHFDGYIHPFFFNDYDIVITASSNLLRDFNKSKTSEQMITRLRKKCYNYQSPLLCLKWWRICFVEGQFSDLLHNGKLYKIVQSTQSVHKWIAPSTIKESYKFLDLDKLFTIQESLNIKTVWDKEHFSPNIINQNGLMGFWYSKLIWRSSTKEFNFDSNLIKSTIVKHNLTFSEIERYLYIYHHNKYIKRINSIIQRKHLEPTFTTIENLGWGTFLDILQPLFDLQYACIQPRNEVKEFVHLDSIMMPLQKALDIIVNIYRKTCFEQFKNLIILNIQIAMCYLKRLDKVNYAIDHIRTIMDLLRNYGHNANSNELFIQMFQLIIIYHKFGQQLYNNIDFNLKKCLEDIENELLTNDNQKLTNIFRMITAQSNKIDDQIRSISVNWWHNMKILDWNISLKDFLAELEVELDYYLMPTESNIAHELNTIEHINDILNVWLLQLERKRKEILLLFKTLIEMDMYDLIQYALNCHIPLPNYQRRNIGNKPCFLCVARQHLSIYVKLLFRSSIKKEELFDESSNKSIHTEQNDKYYYMAQHEILFLKIVQYGQMNITNTDCLQDASEYLKILELQRSEYRDYQSFWDKLDMSLSIHSTIIYAKSITNNTFDEEPESEGFINEINQLRSSVSNTIPIFEKELKNISYYENLKKEIGNSTEVVTCIICLNVISLLAILPCGHFLCCKCLSKLRNDIVGDLSCPICRKNTTLSSILYAKCNQENEIPTTVVKGNYSSKINCIVLTLMKLIAEDPNVKVLIFSGKDEPLQILGNALKENTISYEILKCGNKFKQTLRDFTINCQINALLMHLNFNSIDIDLTIATRVFFMEPNFIKEEDEYAINLINRPGQTKPTFIHQFVVEDSVDEILSNLFPFDNTYSWKHIKLSNILDKFNLTRNNYLA